MSHTHEPTPLNDVARDILGYLIFSTGRPDTSFLRSLDRLYWSIPAAGQGASLAWDGVRRVLAARMEELAREGGPFARASQPTAALDLTLNSVLPAYREFHAELLHHQRDEQLFVPFFVGRVVSAVLRAGPPWSERERIVRHVLGTINDFVGYRPVAVLENGRECLPYDHEAVRPIPLYIRGAGVGGGCYHDLVEAALDILRRTDEGLLRSALFNLDCLEELSLDPRAYDFDHPVQRRPNYHFGEWDPRQVNAQGRYSRFVLRQPTLDALLSWVTDAELDDRPDRLFEAAAVLAGVVLMASGISGDGPGCHDSSVTLGTLMPHIAAYRDAFYQRLLKRLTGSRGERLRAEAQERKQPFAGARQHLNAALARLRNLQRLYADVTKIYARFNDARPALAMAERLLAPSARIGCRVAIALTQARFSLRRADPESAVGHLADAWARLQQGIECGAVMDPWNILGFQSQFPVFDAIENSVPDHRADELIEVMTQLFDLYERVWASAATGGNERLASRAAKQMEELAVWWDAFATTEVESVTSVSGSQAWDSGRLVASAMRAWYEAGAAAGNMAFWRPIVEGFGTAKSYALVLETLLDKQDYTAAMGLYVHWIGRAGEIPLEERDHSFHALALRWLRGVLAQPRAREARNLTCKFIDYLEANADEYWEVPDCALLGNKRLPAAKSSDLDEPFDDREGLYSAAYEGVVYRDTTVDGVEGEMLEHGSRPGDIEFDREGRRLSERLRFHVTLARIWSHFSLWHSAVGLHGEDGTVLERWAKIAARHEQALGTLLEGLCQLSLGEPGTSWEDIVALDRRRGLRDLLAERVILTAVETHLARLFLVAAGGGACPDALDQAAVKLLRSLLEGDSPPDAAEFQHFIGELESQPLLYQAPNRGGDPGKALRARCLHRLLRLLAEWLPRRGMFAQTWELVRRVQTLEWRFRGGGGAVTEFDRLFALACEGIYEGVVASHGASSADDLLASLEQWNELLLSTWLAHSRTLRLSAAEHLGDDAHWPELVDFVRQYGRDLFTQNFFHLGNLRAIRSCGVRKWLRELMEQPDAEELELVRALGSDVSWQAAERQIETIVDAVLDNYEYYRDYNSTTTQSDRGDLLYTFFDLLRIVAQYDRIEWNLRPVLLAHGALLRAGRDEEAERWRRTVAERTADAADQHLRRFDARCKEYGLRLTSIQTRLSERFTRPLEIDRLRALVRACLQADTRSAAHALEALQADVESLIDDPESAGLESPNWLVALREELDRADDTEALEELAFTALIPDRRGVPSVDDVAAQLRHCRESLA